jgi:hypothetical protein
MSIDQQNAREERRPECMSLPLGIEKEDDLARPDSPPLCDLLAEAFEEIEIEWPELLPVERIAAGVMEIAFGLLLFAGLVAFFAFHLKLRLGDSLGMECKPSARVLLERVPARSNVDYYTW